MCGRFALANAAWIQTRFGVPIPADRPAANLNIAPTQMIPVVAGDAVEMMRWDFIPAWWNKPLAEKKFSTFNARAEGLMTSRVFRGSVAQQRCIIPASSFYEWQKIYKEGAAPTPANVTKRIPYEITVKDVDLFGFAGLYSLWHTPEGEEWKTCTLITTMANELMAEIHNRMPVILPRADEALWLSLDETEPERVLPLLRPFPAALMQVAVTHRNLNSRSAPKVDSL